MQHQIEIYDVYLHIKTNEKLTIKNYDYENLQPLQKRTSRYRF